MSSVYQAMFWNIDIHLTREDAMCTAQKKGLMIDYDRAYPIYLLVKEAKQLSEGRMELEAQAKLFELIYKNTYPEEI